MAKPVHTMIRVLDEAKSLDFYARAFGLAVAERLGFPDFALIYLRHPSSPFEVELTVNFDRREPYSLGDGYGHLAAGVAADCEMAAPVAQPVELPAIEVDGT